MSKAPKNSTDLSKEFEIAVGCDPSTMLCKNEKPDVPACNSKCTFNLGFQTSSSFMSMWNFNYSWLSVMSMFSLPV